MRPVARKREDMLKFQPFENGWNGVLLLDKFTNWHRCSFGRKKSGR
jgi:hypothetical protein